MGPKQKTAEDWKSEAQELRARLDEAEETLRAIREGEVDSLLISTSVGDRVYTLEGADHTYRILVESMQQGAATLLEDGSIFYSNQHLAWLLKTPLQRLIGASIHAFVHPADASLFASLLERGRQSSSEGELRFQTADGALIPVFLAFNRLQLGEREGLCLAVTDLTPIAAAQRLAEANTKLTNEMTVRKRAEMALALSARQKALLADASTQVVAQTTVEGVLTVVVDAARELTQAQIAVSGHGYTDNVFHVGASSRADGVIPCPPGEIFKVQAGGVYIDLLTRAESVRLSDDELHGHPAWWGLPAGHVPLRGLLGARLVNVEGKPTGLIMVSDKVAGAEFTEDDELLLRQFAATTSLALQHIEARTQAQQRSEALIRDDRHKDEFLAMLAHELRNPLAPIRNAVHILQFAGANEDVVQSQSSVIERQVAHMAHLLDDLLDISRITQGKIVLRREPLYVTDVIAHAVETVTPLVEDRRHTLAVSVPPGNLRIDGDIDRLVQVVANLLVNAVKYTEEGGRIWLSAEHEGEEAVIRVRDTGVGIAPDMLPHIFDLFAQANQSLDRTQGGMGIGLTMVKNLVRMHGGRVEAHSAGPGQGSEFVIRLPAMGDEAQARDRSTEQVTTAPGKSRRILVVDDLVDTADTMAELLELFGHEVRTAYGGMEALAVARDFRPELVLLDIGMPGMDGYETARRLRAEHGENMLLVALTGYARETDRQMTREAGFNHHLAKPVAPEALRELLTRKEPG